VEIFNQSHQIGMMRIKYNYPARKIEPNFMLWVADKDGFDPSDCIDYIGEMVCEL